MRKHAKSWIMKLLLFLIIIVFALYFGSMGGQQTAEAIATVDGKAISYVEYEKEYQGLLEAAQQQFKGMLTNELIKSLNLKQRALDNLVNQAVIVRKADELGIKVTDEEVRNSILSFPGFQKDGVFREYLYQDLLRMNHLTPEEFEASHKRNILVEKIRELLQSGVFVTDREVFDLYRIRNEKISIQFVKLQAADMAKEISPTQSDLEAFLKQNGDRFRIPEQVRLKYLVFTASDMESSANPAEIDITDYVAQQKDAWQRQNPKLTDTAMRGMAIAELKKILGMKDASRKAKDAHDTIYQEENFDQFAAQNRCTVRSTDFFPLNNPPREFSGISDFTKNLLDLQKDEISPVMFDEHGYYVFQLLEKKPAHLPVLKEVEPTVRAMFVASESQRLVLQKAQAILDRLKKGEAWQKVCAEKGLTSSETGLFLPGEPIPQIGASEEISDSLLSLTVNAPYPEKPFVSGNSVYVIRFLARGNIDPADYEARKGNLKNGLLRFKQEDVIRSWLEANKAAMIKNGRLKINKDAKSL
ncbi:MAG TPA: SurA N-terminal domain-containing protein [Syntrophales bacterium]|nr:SurA N-terminal domain-containing protein [Syntrophales bacterium]HQA82862.1 SurA N-terminal domain-containing protein [Syntrophales bacterium]